MDTDVQASEKEKSKSIANICVIIRDCKTIPLLLFFFFLLLFFFFFFFVFFFLFVFFFFSFFSRWSNVGPMKSYSKMILTFCPLGSSVGEANNLRHFGALFTSF